MEKQEKTLSLRELQAWMKWIITDPRGVDKALANPSPDVKKYSSRYTSPNPSAHHLISKQPPITVANRLEIYAEAYFSRIVESMESDFPATAKILGEIDFQRLVANYLKEYPSSTPNVGEVGKKLSDFVVNYEELKEKPFIRDLIELEWLFVEAFYSDEPGEVFDFTRLSYLTHEEIASHSVSIHPSIRIFKSTWPLESLWKLRDKESTADFEEIKKSEKEEYYLLYRNKGFIEFEKMEYEKGIILSLLRDGLSLAEVIDRLPPVGSEEASDNLTNWFNEWVALRIIVGFATIK